ncbi:unnamed protein product [Orchesella dallaii]|uniref:Uncharacterized protein n=1 Tax=Orchesella dallaii TaxID=48710 RepID=A0ABP1RWY9_9HEXA
MIYKCVIGEYCIVSLKRETKTKLKQIINELYESKRGRHDQEEMKIRLVYVELNYASGTSSGNFASKLLKQGIEMYPDNVHYYTSFCAHEKDLQSQLRYVEIALKRWPHNVNLHYKKATILQRNLLSTCRSSCKNCRCEYKAVVAPRKKKEVVEAYEKFIRKTPKDDRNLPNAYYSIAMIHVIISTDFKMMNYYYKLGKQAEENQLPCFVSDYQNEMCIEKTFVENVRSERSSPQAVDVPNNRILERRKHLKCPVRRWMITRHRMSVNDLNKKKSIKCSSFDPVRKPKEIPPLPDRMYMVKPITIKQMALSDNRIYENRVLELTIIDVPKAECCLDSEVKASSTEMVNFTESALDVKVEVLTNASTVNPPSIGSESSLPPIETGKDLVPRRIEAGLGKSTRTTSYFQRQLRLLPPPLRPQLPPQQQRRGRLHPQKTPLRQEQQLLNQRWKKLKLSPLLQPLFNLPLRYPPLLIQC